MIIFSRREYLDGSIPRKATRPHPLCNSSLFSIKCSWSKGNGNVSLQIASSRAPESNRAARGQLDLWIVKEADRGI